jgi:hypothetical protein
MRHDGDNSLKFQQKRDGIRALPQNPVESARPYLNGGDEETGLVRPRLVATQLACEKCYSLSLIAGQTALLHKLDLLLTLGQKQWRTGACFLSRTSVGFRGL